MKNKFKCLIDTSLLQLYPGNTDKFQNKNLLSYLNDFESSEWRTDFFVSFLFDNIYEAALSNTERSKLIDDPFSSLKKASRNLRFLEDKEGREYVESGEIAEILLYAIMKRHYGALPVVPKIYYKQNPKDTAKGADSVHIVLEENGNFSLWYGEAKFYNDLSPAIGAAVESVHEIIKDDKLKKENSIVTSTRDLDDLIPDEKQLEAIKVMLSSDTSLDKLKPILQIPILILYECSITAKQEYLSTEYCEEIQKLYQSKAEKFFEKLNEECTDVHLYSQIKFHLILVPVPNKKQVVQLFTNYASVLRKS